MIHFFTVAFYQPLLNLLVWLYNTVSFGDFGVAVILLTVVIKVVLWPLGQKSIKSQKALTDLQPKIDEVKKKYKGNQKELGKAMMELYKENKVNPFSSCLPLLIQLPFLFAVYRVFRDGVNNNLDLVYSFIYRPETINTISFGFVDLAQKNIYLALLAGVAQFWQAKMMIAKKPKTKTPGSKDESMAAIMNKQMLYFMPVLTVFIGASLPGGLTLYWFVVTLLTAVQQVIVFKSQKKKKDKDDNKDKNNTVVEGELVKS